MTGAVPREQWSSRIGFLLAVTGAAVGLGSLWRFPYIAGENGGGAFVLLYLAFMLIIGVSLVMAELALGKHGARNPVATIAAVAAEQDCRQFWQAIGWFSVLAPLLATTFYSVVAAWSLYYLARSLGGGLAGLDGPGAAHLFESLLASPGLLVLLQTAYLASVVFIIGRGVRRGIERVSTIMMPLLFALLALLALYATLAGDAAAGWHFLFHPDFSALTGPVVLMALGQALFSVSVGTGAILTYGSYLTHSVSIPAAAWTLALANILTALLAGLAIFPMLFAAGLDPAEGPGLMFVALPIALGNMPGGAFVAVAFFLALFFAAFTSSLAMLEPFISWVTESRRVRRMPAAWLTGAGIWCVGLLATFSFNLLKDFTPLDHLPLFEDRNIFSILDFTVSNLGLPINALLIALFAGWAVNRRFLLGAMGLTQAWPRRLWAATVRYLAPAALTAVFVANL